MDAIISRILEMEKQARGIVRDAEERQLDISGIIEEQKKALLSAEMESAEKRLESERASLLQAAEKEAAQHLARAEEKVKSLDAYSEAHFDEWVRCLYERLTAG